MAALLGPLIVAAIAALIILPQTFFTVDETQVAIVTQLGAFQRAYTEPGLRVKQPFVEQVQRFDKRLQRVEADAASVLTSDKRNLVIDAYARWRITDPLLFFKTLSDERRADARVGDIVASELRREVALDLQEEVIGPRRQAIMLRITQATNLSDVTRAEALALPGGVRNGMLTILLSQDVAGVTARGRAPNSAELAALEREAAPPELTAFKVRYAVPLRDKQGVEIVDVRIKRADFPPDIASSVFARMRAERERIASGLRAEGSQRDAEIRAQVDRQVRVTLQTAEGTSALLRGEAEQEAIRILADALERDPEFYAFRRSLEAYQTSLTGDTTVVLDANSALFKYLQDPSGVTAAP